MSHSTSRHSAAADTTPDETTVPVKWGQWRAQNAVLLAALACVVVAALLPGGYTSRGPHRSWIVGVGISTPGDVARNVVLFVPLGIAAALRPSWTRAWSNRAFLILAAAALSYGLETFQTTLPARYPSLIDVAANTTGTLLGMLCGNVRRRR